MSTISKSAIQPEYKVEVIFLGTEDGKQAEEEILALLKHEFLSKIMSGIHPLSSQSSFQYKGRGIKE